MRPATTIPAIAPGPSQTPAGFDALRASGNFSSPLSDKGLLNVFAELVGPADPTLTQALARGPLAEQLDLVRSRLSPQRAKGVADVLKQAWRRTSRRP